MLNFKIQGWAFLSSSDDHGCNTRFDLPVFVDP